MDSRVDSEAQVNLQPIAAPSILGLYGFAGATLIVAAELAGWYGDSQTALYLAPFAAAFGGIAQFTAGMWAYKVRDAIATAMHGMWGSFPTATASCTCSSLPAHSRVRRGLSPPWGSGLSRWPGSRS